MEYLGKFEVKSAELDGDFVVATLDSGETVRLHKELYDIIKDDKAIDAEISDLKYTCIAKTFLATMSKFDLLAYEVFEVCKFMENLGQNSHVAATKKLWGGKTANSVSIRDIESILKG